MNILFVCTGNTCRSPMAEGYLNSLCLKNVMAKSRGIAPDGSNPSQNAVDVMKEIGIDISSHISQQITIEDIENSDIIICLSCSHLHILKKYVSSQKTIIVLGNGISDPYGCNIDIYKKCRDEIISSIDKLVSKGFFCDFRIVPMETHHIPSIAILEKTCFTQNWSYNAILESFESGTRFFVAENDKDVIGYAGVNVVLDEGYITNIAVFPSYREKGVGTALINSIFSLANKEKLSFVSLEVRKSNDTAIRLYVKHGFLQEGVRKNFYCSPKEDALIMTKRFN